MTKSNGKDQPAAGGYEVGYGKPPLHSQFQPGRSGNPAGRRKGVRNLKTDVIRTLSTPLKVKEGGRTRIKSTQEAALLMLREKALRGDARALDGLLELARHFNNDLGTEGSNQPLPADDQQILAAYLADCREAHGSETTSVAEAAASAEQTETDANDH